MSDGRKYYCFCEANCRFETMSKEQILAAIAQAAESGLVFDTEAAFITKVKEGNAGGFVSFWLGTQAQYNAHVARGEKDPNCFYILTDCDSPAELSQKVKYLQQYIDDSLVNYVTTSEFKGGLDTKAPAGFGLGKDIDELPTANDANDCVKNGWYKLIIQTTNGIGAQGIMRVDAEGGANIVQTAYAGYSTSRGMVIKQRVKHQGTWGEWEYVTPLCVSGEEYRTTERFDGAPVYCKVISFGTLPNSTFKNVAHGITGKVRNVRYEITTISTARIFSSFNGISDVVVDNTNVKITTNQNLSDISVSFVLWYTKS